MDAGLALLLVGLFVFAWFGIWKIIPSCSVSQFRYRLWRRRDTIFDELRAGAYENTEEPEKLIANIELTIRFAQELRLSNFALVHVLCRGKGLPSEHTRSKLKIDLDRLGPSDRKRLGHHVKAFHGALTRQVLLGSPSGWITLIVFGAMAVLTQAWRRVTGSTKQTVSVLQGAKEHVRDEIDLEPTLDFLDHHSNDRKSLSAHV